MSAFPEARIAAVAGALHHSTATNTTINVGDVIKPLQVISSGLSASFSYDSGTGLFTLDSNKKYYVESNIYVEAQGVTYNCLHGFTDSGGTELTDSARGRQTGPTPSTYYNNYNHQQECAPEIEALESCGRQVSLLEQQQTQAEGRGLERCVERERESCEVRIRATEEAASHLDCIICRQRCPDGSIP